MANQKRKTKNFETISFVFPHFPSNQTREKQNFEAQKLTHSPRRQSREPPFGAKPWRAKSRENTEGAQE